MQALPSPYTFANLPKLKKTECVAINWFLDHLDDRWLGPKGLAEIQAQLSDISGIKIKLRLNNLQIGSQPSFLQATNEAFTFAALSFPATRLQAAFAVDTNTARKIVHKVLGIEATSYSQLALSDLERGVWKFFLLKVAHRLNAMLKSYAISVPRIDGIFSSIDELTNVAGHASTKLNIDLALDVNGHQGQALFAIDADSMRSLPMAKLNERDVTVNQGLARASGVTVPLVAAIGTVSLSPSDLAKLEVDDIIVVENSSVRMKETGLSGELQCKIGEPEAGLLFGRLFLTSKGKFAIQINDMVPTTLAKTDTD